MNRGLAAALLLCQNKGKGLGLPPGGLGAALWPPALLSAPWARQSWWLLASLRRLTHSQCLCAHVPTRPHCPPEPWPLCGEQWHGCGAGRGTETLALGSQPCHVLSQWPWTGT